MVCKKCGADIPEDSKACPQCGESMYHKVTEAADSFFDKAEAEVSATIHDVSEEIHFENNESNELKRLSTDRGLITYIFLSIITLGIYSYYFIYKIAKDVNVACEDDGEETAGLVKFVILSFLTCGIYSWF